MKILGILFLVLSWNLSFAQPYKMGPVNRALSPYPEVNKERLALVLGGEALVYGSASLALYEFWYKDIPSTSFHTFNDNDEWMQLDKAGHLHTAYFYSDLSCNFYNWAGVQSPGKYYYSFMTSNLLQLTIEVFDGYTEKWGFSWGDMGSNFLGSGLHLGQGLLWDEQRIRTKYSFHRVDHPDDFVLQQRVENLYGTNIFEQALKDYNGATYWLSINPNAFGIDLFKGKLQWLNLALGYGAEGMYGGRENRWCFDEGVEVADCMAIIDRSDVRRYRQLFIAPDIDFARIQTNSRIVKMLLHFANIFKCPAPSLEISGEGGLKFHWLYF